MSRIIIVDDEEKITKLLADRVSREGHEVSTFNSAESALSEISRMGTDVVLCDLRLGGMDGLELLTETKKVSPDTDFVIMTAYASTATAVRAMREGAYEYLVKPFDMDEMILLLKRIMERRDLMIENVALKERISASSPAERIIGGSAATRNLRETIAKVAPTDTPVLIRGESGTGKELVAAAIHNSSKRAGKPFIVINCAAVPGSLIESEMFGHEKGSFTGAVQKKPGQFKLADGGSLFLDEIGELPVLLQSKLLRAIENGEFLPVGGTRPVRVDVRIIAATNRDLEKMEGEGSFRSDLLYRLNVFPILIPPLSERKDDIAEIGAAFLSSKGFPAARVERGVWEKLMSYSWPGNVRELRNILERATILAGGDPISPSHIMITEERPAAEARDILEGIVGRISLPEVERSLLRLALEKAGGNKSRAAEMLGITRRTLYSRMEKHGEGEKDPGGDS